MTAQEFINQNHDILLSPITPDEFQTLTDGQPYFCITVNAGKKTPLEREVRAAGYQLVVATSRNPGGDLAYVSSLGLTQRGYAKIDYIEAEAVSAGRVLLFHCKPLPSYDSRSNCHWQI